VLRAGTGSFWACTPARLAVERRQAAFLLGQEALCSSSRMMRARPVPASALAFAAAGSAGRQVWPGQYPARATDQDIYLSPGQAQRLGCLIGGFMPDHQALPVA
jgi:hypothetical protein